MDTVICPGCGEENPARFRLCGFCGTPLGTTAPTPAPPPGTRPAIAPGTAPASAPGTAAGSQAATITPPPPATTPAALAPSSPAPARPRLLPTHEVRKTVTIIFSDLKGSTELGEQLDPEALHEVKDRYFDSMAAEIARHGGKIEKYIGDAIMAVFGLPRAHQDDALRAVRAAHGMQAALAELNGQLEMAYGVRLANRTGVNTGEVVANVDPNADQKLATGDAVNVAARLEQAAPAMEVLIGATTHELVRASVEVEEVEPLQLKGKSERVPAYRLVALRERPAPVAGSARQPIVGREEELAGLRGILDEAVRTRSCRLATIVGEAGVGKSRLVAEFVGGSAETARVVHGRCLPYGDGITFWPLAEIVRQAAGVVQDDAAQIAVAKVADLLAGAADQMAIVERVASAIGLSSERFPVDELFWAGRRLLETLADERALIVVVDDIHTAEATFLEFLEHLLEASRAAPLLVVASARHTLLERQPEWSTGSGSIRIELAPLTATDSELIVDGLLDGASIDADVRRRIVEAAAGNPLFVEQLMSMLVDKGLVGRADEGSAEVGDIAVPPTIQALLTERLDDLTTEERSVIEPAAVIGQVFPTPAVEELVPDVLRPDVDVQLDVLDRKQFVLPAATPAGDDAAYRFRHLLIRDATYQSLLKRARAAYHERFVVWAERVNRERGREQEFEEILGYHLEQAYRYRAELGAIGDEGRRLAARAAGKLSSAGRRAFGRGDIPAAVGLLRRAVALLPDLDPERIELLSELGDALIEAGELVAAADAADEAARGAEQIGDERLAARARLVRLNHALLAAGSGAGKAAIETATAAITTFEATGDWRGLARGFRLLMLIHGTAGRYEDAAEAARRTVETARDADDGRLAARGAIGYAVASLHGPTPADEALAICSGLIADTRGDRKAGATILGAIALLQAMLGDIEAARQSYRRYRATLVELGPSVTAWSTSIEAGRVELLAGDPAAAVRELRRDEADLAAIGERYFRSTVAGLLAHALHATAELDEAEAMAELASELADADDLEAQVLWRTARAKITAERGEPDTSIDLARAAVALAAETADVVLHADALRDVAAVLSTLGRGDEAAGFLREALGLYRAKGNRVATERTERSIAQIAAP